MVQVITEKIRANFPVVSLVAFLVGVAFAVWELAALHNHIENRFAAIDRAQAAISGKIVGRGPNGWHYQQMDRFCLEATRANPGWKCPDPRDIINRTHIP